MCPQAQCEAPWRRGTMFLHSDNQRLPTPSARPWPASSPGELPSPQPGLEKASRWCAVARHKARDAWITLAQERNTSQKSICWDFPGGPAVKNPLANAGDSSSIPGSGRYAMGQLSTWATTTEPVLFNKGSHCNEKTSHHRAAPPAATRESLHTAAKTQPVQNIFF